MPNVFVSMTFSCLRFEGGINGASLFRGDGTKLESIMVAVDHWILPADNRFTFRLGPAPDPARQAPSVELEVWPSSNPEGEPFARFQWNHDATPFTPFELEIPFVPPSIPETVAWSKAEKLTAIDGTLRDELVAAALAVHATFAKPDVDALMKKHLALRSQDLVKTMGSDPAKFETRFKGALSDMTSKKDARPVKAADLSLRLVAQGQAVHVTAGGHELLETPRGNIATYFGRVDGQWVIVR